jgi:hypothetical protein
VAPASCMESHCIQPAMCYTTCSQLSWMKISYCLLSLWRVVRGIKLTSLASRTHGLFIT